MTDKEIGVKIKEYRQNHNLTQEELARKLDIPTITISRWERGKNVSKILTRGGTILGTSRTNLYKDPQDKDKAIKNFKKLNLYALVAIGGEDTLGVANKLNKEGP